MHQLIAVRDDSALAEVRGYSSSRLSSSICDARAHPIQPHPTHHGKQSSFTHAYRLAEYSRF